MCEAHLIASHDHSSCITPFCEENEVLSSNGFCQSCPPYQSSSFDKRTCVNPTCEDDAYMINVSGGCHAVIYEDYYDKRLVTIKDNIIIMNEQHEAQVKDLMD